MTFTFIITDWFQELDFITVMVTSPNLEQARRKAHIIATLNGFDNDCLTIRQIT